MPSEFDDEYPPIPQYVLQDGTRVEPVLTQQELKELDEAEPPTEPWWEDEQPRVPYEPLELPDIFKKSQRTPP